MTPAQLMVIGGLALLLRLLYRSTQSDPLDLVLAFFAGLAVATGLLGLIP